MATQFGAGILVVFATVSGCAIGQNKVSDSADTDTESTSAAAAQIKDVRFVIKTTKGDIEGKIFATKTPVTAANFCNLVKNEYYDGMVFHRVIPDFMIQVGDPLTKQPGNEFKWGTGGPGYEFEDEIRQDNRHNRPGILSMANAGPGTNGSQIFITHGPTPHLDRKHTVFGAVTAGQDIVDTIQKYDEIVEAKILDDTTALFETHANRIEEWNSILKKEGYIE